MKGGPTVTLVAILAGVGLFSAGLVFLARKPIGIGDGQRRRGGAHAATSADQPAASPERYVGVVVSRAAIDLTPRIDGRLKHLFVTVGQQVKANDLIALIDDEALKKDLQLAQASLQASKAGAARAQIELGDARAKSSRRAEVAAELSKEEVAAAKTAERLGGASVSAANAAVAEQRARIAKLEEQLRYTEVRAPFAGKISTANVTLGAQLTTQTPIVRLVQNESLCVRFAVPATSSRELVVGRPIRFDLETATTSLPGTIENVAPEVDPGSQMLYVEASLDLSAAARAKIQPGLVARVRFATADEAGDHRGWQEAAKP